jgi:hypothetical protein
MVLNGGESIWTMAISLQKPLYRQIYRQRKETFTSLISALQTHCALGIDATR